MHIEVFEGKDKDELRGDSHPAWFWHFKNRGRVTADSEAFPTKYNAERAAVAVVRAVIKEVSGDAPISFYHGTDKKGVHYIKWD
jgi:hypothetical protein